MPVVKLDLLRIFVADFAVRLFLADERVRDVVRHWYDVLGARPAPLRPLRLLRLIPLLSVLSRHAKIRLRGRVGVYVAGGASLLLCAVLAVLDQSAERLLGALASEQALPSLRGQLLLLAAAGADPVTG